MNSLTLVKKEDDSLTGASLAFSGVGTAIGETAKGAPHLAQNLA